MFFLVWLALRYSSQQLQPHQQPAEEQQEKGEENGRGLGMVTVDDLRREVAWLWLFPGA